MIPPRFQFTRIPGVSPKAVLVYVIAVPLVVVFSLRTLAFRALLPVKLRAASGELDEWLEALLADDEEEAL